MKRCKNILVIIFLLISYCHSYASNYYWVGGTGNFSDTLHWATTSGGTTNYAVIPTNTDDVFFDSNSFPGANDTVYFDLAYQEAHHFSTAGATNNPTFYDGPAALYMTVLGNFELTPGVNWKSICTLELNTEDVQSTIMTNGVYITNSVIIGGSAISTTSLLDNFSCANFELDGNDFITNNHNISTGVFIVNSTGVLQFGTSNISASSFMNFFLGGTGSSTFYSDSATFISEGVFDTDYGASGVHYGTVYAQSMSNNNCYFKAIHCSGLAGSGNHVELIVGDFWIGPWATQYGEPNYITKIIAPYAIAVDGSNVIDTIIFTHPGASLAIKDTLTLNGEIYFNNTPAYPGSIAYNGSDSGYIYKTGGIVCFDFLTIQNVHAFGGAQYFAGSNSTDLGGSVGWQFTGCTTSGGVWPGDANYDLTVNNLDILAIGLANGETGAVRAGASSAWVEQPVSAWANSFASGVNMKHADCEGNGIVDASDTAAVSINYGLHHPASKMIKPEIAPASSSYLVIDVSPDTVGPSSSVHVNIDLSIDSIYGIAFSVYYNPALIDAASLVPDFSNSWLGTSGVNMIGFAKADPLAGRIDFAMTRTDHTDAIGGIGHLISFDLITESSIPAGSSLTMEADNVNGVFLSENYEAITGSSDSSIVSVLPVATTYLNLASFIRNNTISVNYFNRKEGEINLSLTDITGRNMMQNKIAAIKGINHHEIPIGDLANGIYLLTLNGAEGSKSIKVIKE